MKPVVKLILITGLIAFLITGYDIRRQIQPNEIIIMTDDQGSGDMSCNGHPKLHPPNINRIKNELRCWPRELGKTINAFKGIEGRVHIKEFKGDAVQVEQGNARIKIGDQDETVKVNAYDAVVTFQVAVLKGKIDLLTWVIDRNGTKRTAYGIYITKRSGYKD